MQSSTAPSQSPPSTQVARSTGASPLTITAPQASSALSTPIHPPSASASPRGTAPPAIKAAISQRDKKPASGAHTASSEAPQALTWASSTTCPAPSSAAGWTTTKQRGGLASTRRKCASQTSTNQARGSDPAAAHTSAPPGETPAAMAAPSAASSPRRSSSGEAEMVSVVPDHTPHVARGTSVDSVP